MRIETLKEIGKVRRCAHGLTKEIKTPEHKENRGADDMPDRGERLHIYELDI
jgi:hypothetical protein